MGNASVIVIFSTKCLSSSFELQQRLVSALVYILFILVCTLLTSNVVILSFISNNSLGPSLQNEMDFRRPSFVFAVLMICSACAQRPFYASGGSQYPGVLPQNVPTDVDNRFGENNTTPDPYKAHEKDPVYNVDKDLVERIKNDYPADKQPYWYVNAAQINSSRYQQLRADLQELNDRLKRLEEAQRANALAQQQQSRRNN